MKNHLEKLRTALQMRRDLTIDILSPLKELHFEIPNGGFNLWVTLPDSIDPFTLLQKANEVDVSFLPGTACLLNYETNDNQLRISYSMLNEKDMEIGLEKLHDTIRKSIC
ncbi:2-aminoadipate transaminase [Streptococcus pneumoniae]|nr:2-aminoadipate transaminase [Streptococcus pneumoniae]CJQ71412.1 2-aminoadipate transaminase [Streptococcus pneumoniae]